MKSSESIAKIAPAFLKAQKEMEAVTKNSKNPFFKSDYADLNAVMEACKEPLNNNGISILQPVNSQYVETVLMHESGEWFASETALIVKESNNPQSYGSSVSYARRYGLMSILGLPAEDDDGEKAMARDTKPVTKAVEAPKTENGKDTAIKALYGVIRQKGLDPAKGAVQIALNHDKPTIGSLTVEEIVGEAKIIREMTAEEFQNYVNRKDDIEDALSSAVAEFDK